MKFALIHHSACAATAFHYVIARGGEARVDLPESMRGAQPRSIAICLEGDFRSATPPGTAVRAVTTTGLGAEGVTR